MTGQAVFFWGLLGGAAAEFLSLRAIYEENRERWIHERVRLAFWVFTAGFIALGGLMALGHQDSSTELTRLLAINVGFTWPLLFRRAAGAAPAVPYNGVD